MNEVEGDRVGSEPGLSGQLIITPTIPFMKPNRTLLLALASALLPSCTPIGAGNPLDRLEIMELATSRPTPAVGRLPFAGIPGHPLPVPLAPGYPPLPIGPIMPPAPVGPVIPR